MLNDSCSVCECSTVPLQSVDAQRFPLSLWPLPAQSRFTAPTQSMTAQRQVNTSAFAENLSLNSPPCFQPRIDVATVTANSLQNAYLFRAEKKSATGFSNKIINADIKLIRDLQSVFLKSNDADPRQLGVSEGHGGTRPVFRPGNRSFFEILFDFQKFNSNTRLLNDSIDHRK